jgi:hypothetical protein
MPETEKSVQAAIISFRAEPALQAWTDKQAALEGISRSDYARRLLLQERQRQQAKKGSHHA